MTAVMHERPCGRMPKRIPGGLRVTSTRKQHSSKRMKTKACMRYPSAVSETSAGGGGLPLGRTTPHHHCKPTQSAHRRALPCRGDAKTPANRNRICNPEGVLPYQYAPHQNTHLHRRRTHAKDMQKCPEPWWATKMSQAWPFAIKSQGTGAFQ